jgi:hypothetical protein
MRIRLLAAACVVSCCVASAVAVADTTTVEDNQNTSANLLDIEQAAAGHQGGLLQHTVETYRSWRSRQLRSTRALPRAICVYVWKTARSKEGKQDYEICARFRKGKLRGTVLRVRPKPKRIGAFEVRRLNLRSVSFVFDSDLIGSPRSYKWEAVTGYTGKGCPKDPPFQFGCDDSAPTNGVRVHDLGIAAKKR